MRQIQIHEIKLNVRQNNFDVYGVVEASSEKAQTTVLLITPVGPKYTLEEMNVFFWSVAKVFAEIHDAKEFKKEDGRIWFGTIQMESYQKLSSDGKVLAFDHTEIIVLPHDDLLIPAKGHERYWIECSRYEQILYPPAKKSWF